MKYYRKIWALLFFTVLIFSCSNQNEQVSDNNKELMVTFEDSLSYSVGVNIGKNLPKANFNQKLIIEGLLDYWEKEEPRLDSPTRNDLLRAFNIMNAELERDEMRGFTEKAAELSRKNKIKGQEFLEKNKTEEGIRVFSRSQIQYRMIAEGSGDIPDYNDTVKVHYNGYLLMDINFIVIITDWKNTPLNSNQPVHPFGVFCLKKKKKIHCNNQTTREH